MSTIQERIETVLSEHDEFTYDAEHRETVCTGCGWAITNVMNPNHDGKFHERKREHQAAMLSTLIREAQAEAFEAEAKHLRELHVLIEETPWNPMPQADKDKCNEFMAEAAVSQGEYTNRHMTNYAAWLEYRAAQLRSNA